MNRTTKKRKQAVQHAFQNKISADRLNNINNKCVSSKHNSKGFWEMLREDISRGNPSHFIDRVDKTALIENKGKIVLRNTFSDIGKDNLVSHRYQAKIKTFVDNIKNNIKFRRKICFL